MGRYYDCQNSIVIYGVSSFLVMLMLLLLTDSAIVGGHERRFPCSPSYFVRNVRINTLLQNGRTINIKLATSYKSLSHL